MFCYAARRKCHVLSWSAAPPPPVPPVRILHAVPPSHSVPFAPPRRTRRTLQMAALTPPPRTRRTLQMAAFPPPPACPASGTPIRAYRARPPARVSAGAVRAPDCARARKDLGAARTSPVRFSGVFSRRREPGDEAAPRGCRFLASRFNLTTDFPGSARIRNYFWICEQMTRFHSVENAGAGQ